MITLAYLQLCVLACATLNALSSKFNVQLPMLLSPKAWPWSLRKVQLLPPGEALARALRRGKVTGSDVDVRALGAVYQCARVGVRI